ncbi:MAG: hypothetical protein ACEQSL_01580 [Sediminibacterium sp.]
MNQTITIPGPEAITILRNMEKTMNGVEQANDRKRLAELNAMNLKWSDVNFSFEKNILQKRISK